MNSEIPGGPLGYGNNEMSIELRHRVIKAWQEYWGPTGPPSTDPNSSFIWFEQGFLYANRNPKRKGLFNRPWRKNKPA